MRELSFISLLSICIICNAQFFPVRQYMTYDGMPSSAIYDIDQAPNGMMWFLSAKGPLYYDATSWHSFSDSIRLPSSPNSRISLDSEGNVWVAGFYDTDFVIAQHSKEGWTEAPAFGRSKSKKDWVFAFCALATKDKGLVAIADLNVIYILQKETKEWVSVNFDEGVSIYNITISEEGTQWIATSDGLFTLRDNVITPAHIASSQLPNNAFLNVVYSKYDSTFYYLGDTWLAREKEGDIEVISREVPINTALIRLNKSNLVIDNSGRIFAGSNVPAHYFEATSRKWKKLLIEGLDLNINSTRLFCDRENNLWVGDSRGLFKFNLLQFTNFNRNTGLGENEVSAIMELSDGRILMANPHYLNTWNGGEIKTYLVDPQLTQNFRILDLMEDPSSGLVYVAAGYGGLLVFESNDLSKPVATYKSPPNGFVAIEKYKGEIYLASPGKLTKLVDGKLIIVEVGLSYVRNLTIVEDMLAITSGRQGLILYDGETLFPLKAATRGFSNVYKPIYYQGYILVSTRDGIGIVRNNQIVPWDSFDYGLPTYSLLNVSNEELWIGTDQGIFKFDGQETVHYGIPQGLVGNEVNRNAFIKDRNENIWVGMEKGVSMFQRKKINVPVYKAVVEITEINSNLSQNLDLQKTNEFKFKENTIAINYQCLSYIREQDLELRYQLFDPDESSNNSWEYITDFTSSRLEFTNLSPGRYKLRIQAKNQGYDWGEADEIEWVIKQPYYNQWWFILSTGFFSIAIIGGLFRVRFQYLIRRQHKLETLVNSRTAEIRELNEHLEEKVDERTSLLKERNRQLREYAFINAHLLRSPLTRIMSVLMLLKKEEKYGIDDNYIALLDQSTKELDDVIHSINDKLSEEDQQGEDR